MAGRVEDVDVVVGLDLAEVERLVPLEVDDVAEVRREALREAGAAVAVAEVVEALRRQPVRRQRVEIDVLLPGRDELSAPARATPDRRVASYASRPLLPADEK